MLFLDDSGKPDLSHPSLGLVIGGFSVPSTQVPTLRRRVAGAKARFYPWGSSLMGVEVLLHRQAQPVEAPQES